MKTAQAILAIFIGVCIALAASAVLNIILAIPVMLLWDWLMPTLFGLGKITYWQAWGLLFLCGILLKLSVSMNGAGRLRGR